MQYCSNDRLEAFLPTGHGYDAGELTAFVASASGYVQDSLPNYWPFGDYNATVATPETIQLATVYYAAHAALTQLGQENLLSEGSPIAGLIGRADQICADLASGKRQIAPVQVTGESLAFGSDADYSNWSFLANTEVYVIPESAEIPGYENGTEFRIGWSDVHRSWYVERIDGAISDSDTVSYLMSYLRTREKMSTPTRSGGDLVRG